MNDDGFRQREAMRGLAAESLAEHQLLRLNQLLYDMLPHNRFYGAKLSSATLPLESLSAVTELPFTYKEELVSARQEGDLAANLTFPVERYVHFHRTSGTHGRPLVVLDTAADWDWWIDCWQYVLDAAELGSEERVLLGFSFGPFIGFWSAFDAVTARGCLAIPSGGLSTLARLELLESTRATALFCTPTYALHLAEVAAQNQRNVASLDVRRIVVAGEPGGSVPAVRQRIESSWNARVVDHSGATEVGAWGFADPAGRGLFVNEAEFFAEFLSLKTGLPAGEGELSELVLTTLGRVGCPVIRYRTGDVVRPVRRGDEACQFVMLDGGVLGRADDMMIVRGVNIFPSSIEQILHGFPEIIEYRLTARKQGEMDALYVQVEDRLEQPDRIARELELRLGIRIEVSTVPTGSLPRFEGKGKRFVDERNS
jgi:phenylacetate-CoA ligase